MERRTFLRAAAGTSLPGVTALASAVTGAGMHNAEFTSTAFSGLRIQRDSAHSFEQVLGRLHAQLGATPVNLPRVLAAVADAPAFEAALQRYIGPTGFMLFASLNHGAWLEKFGIHARQLRLIFGNPLIAVTMIRHDLNAGLFVPVELLLTERPNGHGCSITYVVPSSLMLVAPNPALTLAARELDDKLAALVAFAISA